jgi:salicylate hydroxylase
MLATFGQGANMAFEDAYVLARWLNASPENPEAALVNYEAVRKPRATRVQQLSRTEVRFKKMHSDWDRLRREFVFVTRHGSTTGSVYRWIFGYDPVTQWRGRESVRR